MPSREQSQYTQRLLLGFQKGIFTGRTTKSSQLSYDKSLHKLYLASGTPLSLRFPTSNPEVETFEYLNPEYRVFEYIVSLCSLLGTQSPQQAHITQSSILPSWLLLLRGSHIKPMVAAEFDGGYFKPHNPLTITGLLLLFPVTAV